MTSNPGKRILVYDVPGIFTAAYNHAANIEDAVSFGVAVKIAIVYKKLFWHLLFWQV